jgi:hypothetical protein
MFVRKKTTRSGTVRYYLCECRCEGGKVRQKVLCYLGGFQTAEAALLYWEEQIERCKEEVAGYRARGRHDSAAWLEARELAPYQHTATSSKPSWINICSAQADPATARAVLAPDDPTTGTEEKQS